MNRRIPVIRFSCMAIVTLVVFACQPKSDTYKGPEKDKSKYGPQAHVYEQPNIQGTIYYVAPDGNNDASGMEIEHPTTIESAIAKTVSGDAIVMRGGTYRTGNLTFNQGITIQPYKDEKPVLNGTFVAENWVKSDEGLWVCHWDRLFPGAPESWWHREREEKFTPLHRFNNDGIFIDGQFLLSVGSKQDVSEETYFVDYEKGEIYIGSDPTGKLVEITAFRKAIMRTTQEVHGKVSDGKGPVIRGLTITQYPDTMVHIDGYYPQGVSAESDHGKDVVGTVFDNCTFSKCFRMAVFAIGDSMVMRHCKIIDSNTEGLYIVASSDVLLEWNIFANNNIERWTGFYPSAVKIFNQTHRVVCRNNLIIDHPHSNGLWYDVGNLDGVFVNNWVENVGDVSKYKNDERIWASYSGFFYEISSKAICAGNVFLNNAQGIFILNSSEVEIYNNTLINSTVSFGRNNRGDDTDHFGWHILTGPGVDHRDNHNFFNNILYTDEWYIRPALVAWQPANMCERLNKPQLAGINNNLYIRPNKTDSLELISWSPAESEECKVPLNLPEELTALYPLFSTQCKLVQSEASLVFAGFDHFNFQLKRERADSIKAVGIPQELAKVMGIKNQMPTFLGAYGVK